ncbi:unnamed protein product [Ectocarpus sp. 6 AP-2014]
MGGKVTARRCTMSPPRRASTAASKSFLAVSGAVSRDWLRHEVGEEVAACLPVELGGDLDLAAWSWEGWVGRRIKREDLAESNMNLAEADSEFAPATWRYLDACHRMAEATGTQDYAHVLVEALEGGLTVPVAWVKRTLGDMVQARQAHERTSSGGDVWVCVDRLCGMSRELVVVCPASNEADPLHISAEFEIDNSSDSFGLNLRRKREGGAALPSLLPPPPAFSLSSLPSLLSPGAAVTPKTATTTGTASGNSSGEGSVGVPTAAGAATPAAAPAAPAAAIPVAGEAEQKNNKPRPPAHRYNGTGQAHRRSSEGSYNGRPRSPQQEAAAAAAAAATSGGVCGAGGRLSAFATASAVALSTRGGVGAAAGAAGAGAGEGGKVSRDRACVRVTVTTEMSYKVINKTMFH